MRDNSVKCEICNSDIPLGSSFCPGCGKPVLQMEEKTIRLQEQGPIPYSKPNVNPMPGVGMMQPPYQGQMMNPGPQQFVVKKKPIDLGVKYVWMLIIIMIAYQITICATAFSGDYDMPEHPNFFDRVEMTIEDGVLYGIGQVTSGRSTWISSSDAEEYYNNPTQFISDTVDRLSGGYKVYGYMPLIFFGLFMLIALIGLFMKAARPAYTKKSFSAVLVSFIITIMVSTACFAFIIGIISGGIKAELGYIYPSIVIPASIWIFAILGGVAATILCLYFYSNMMKKYTWCRVEKAQTP